MYRLGMGNVAAHVEIETHFIVNQTSFYFYAISAVGTNRASKWFNLTNKSKSFSSELACAHMRKEIRY
jgi:hypothetical protein